MGRLEKIVVLTVLFLVAVVLGVALTPSSGAGAHGGGSNPVQGAIDPAQPNEKPANANPTRGLLNAEADLNSKTAPHDVVVPDAMSTATPATNVAGDAPATIPNNATATTPIPGTPAPLPERAVAKFILTLDGLEASNAPDMMFYPWKQGDTLAALALRYYGSKEKVTRLTKANEGRTEASFKVDERLWVPIAESSKADASANGKFYVVKAGDVLGAISQQFYGTSKKWQKILDANRDTLSSPEKLRPGMKLRIPE